MRTSWLPCTLIALGALLLQPHPALAGPDLNLRSRLLKAFLVQAMDECTSAVTNVGGVGACPGANVDTDGTPFTLGRVNIKAREGRRQVLTIIKSSKATPPAALANKTLHVEIVLRITSTTEAVFTWVDQLVICPDFSVPSNGNAKNSVSLLDCGLPPMLGADTTNKEIISFQVVDSDTGKTVAVPGVRWFK